MDMHNAMTYSCIIFIDLGLGLGMENILEMAPAGVGTSNGYFEQLSVKVQEICHPWVVFSPGMWPPP